MPPSPPIQIGDAVALQVVEAEDGRTLARITLQPGAQAGPLRSLLDALDAGSTFRVLESTTNAATIGWVDEAGVDPEALIARVGAAFTADVDTELPPSLRATQPGAERQQLPAVRYTTTAPTRASRGRVDVEAPRAAVVIPPEQLRDLSPSARSAAAGVARLPLATLDGLIAGGLPLPLETHRRGGTAIARAQQLRNRTGLPVQPVTGGGVMRPLMATALLVTAAATGAGAALFGSLGVSVLPLFGFLMTALMVGLAGWIGYGWNHDRRLLAATLQASREARDERADRAADPELASAWAALHTAREALAGADLPGIAGSDLRDVLAAAEQELDALSTARQAVRRGLASTSAADVRSRIQALDADDPTLGPRLASLNQTLEQLEDLEASAEQITSRTASLQAVLTQLATSVERWRHDPDDDAAADVARATQAARDARTRQVSALRARA